jgi:hypothetical protein
MGYDPTVCYNSIIAQGKGPCPNALGTASSYHCLDAQESGPIHAFCVQVGNYYLPFQFSEAYNTTKCTVTEYNPVKCEEKVFATITELTKFLRVNPDFDARDCYCCCACLAYGTPIAIPTGMQAIEKIRVGDEVMAGSIDLTGGKIALSWRAATVKFSQGTPPSDPKSGIASTMVFIFCKGDAGIIATEDQLLLMGSGKLKQAGTVVPGDRIATVDGGSIPIRHVRIGNWYGGVHHLAAKKTYTGDVNGHLLNAGGLVIGDYTLQMDPVALGDQFEAAAVIGSDDYDTQNASKKIAPGVYTIDDSYQTIKTPQYFKDFALGPVYIPSDASLFITQKQAIDIVGNRDAHFRPFGNKSGIDGLSYLFKLYKGFYPDFNFYLDWENIAPNAYAFEAYGMKNVVISGGLIRLDGLYIEGQASILAHCIARLANIKTYSGPHPLPTIQADYYGMGLMMPTVWNFNAYAIDGKAIKQMEQFWGYISSEDQKGNPDDPQNEPSIDCRITTLMYARLGGELPPCAEPPVVLLEVTSAEAGLTSKKEPYVIVGFNEVVGEVSASNPENYSFDPAVTVSAVQVNLSNGRHVQINADFTAGVKYTVTVSNVTSGTGAPLDPAHAKANFTGQ